MKKTKAVSISTLKESDLPDILNESSESLIVTDPHQEDNPIIYVNRGFERLTGYRAAEVIGKNCRFMQGKDRDQESVAKVREALRRQKPVHAVLRNYKKDGTLFYNSLFINPVRGPGGRLKYFVGIQHDDTERFESEQRFRQLAENISEVFWITSADGKEMIYVSPSYEAVWGRSCRSLYENPHGWLEAIVEEDRPAVEKSFFKMAIHGQFDIEYRIRRPDGGIRWIHDRGFPVLDHRGKPYRIAGIAEHITQRKQSELEREELIHKLREHQDRLEEMVQARTRELNDKNIALKEILSQLEIEKKNIKEHAAANLDGVILPALKQLIRRSGTLEKRYLHVLQKNLEQLTSTFGVKLTSKSYGLTPRQVEICNLIRAGLENKEIADQLKISLSTVENQRNAIRKKLGISRKDVNLTTYLRSL